MERREEVYTDTPPAGGKERPSRTWWAYTRWIVPVVLVAALGSTLGAYLYLASHEETFTGERVVDRPATPMSFSLPLLLTRRVNVLLIGTDVTLGNKRQILPLARADTLLAVSFDPDGNRISALAIPRDTRAAIPGVGVNKINASYAFGGPGLTVKTVEDLLGVHFDYYIKLGPKSFARLIDAIGGVTIDVEKDMKYDDNWAGLHINLKKGRQMLDGTQAEGYIRFRKDALGDIGRVERQRKLLLALFAKIQGPSAVVRAPQLLRAFTENTQTNLTLTELMTLGMFGIRLEPTDVTTATLPGSFGRFYWTPDEPKVRPMVLDMFYGVSADLLTGTRIEVLNGSGTPGLARRTATRLERLGFRIVRVASAPQAERTVIIDHAGRPQIARLLADALGQPQVVREDAAAVNAAGDVDITVLLARDFVAAVPRTQANP